MKKIETNTHLSYEKIADIVIDRKRLCSETLGRYQGNIILHKSYTVNMGSGYGEESEYYILSPEECQRYSYFLNPQGKSNSKNKKKKK